MDRPGSGCDPRPFLYAGVAVMIMGSWVTGGLREFSTPQILSLIATLCLLSAAMVVRHFQWIGDDVAKGGRSAVLFAVAFLFMGLHVFLWPRHGSEMFGKVFGAVSFLASVAYLVYRLVRRSRIGATS